MTIIMKTSVCPSSLPSEIELSKDELKEFVSLGILSANKNHKEHYAIQPYWINDPANGILEEIRRKVIGKWNNKLNSYVVAVKNIQNFDNSAGMNEDHQWLHVDVTATYYTFSPQEGQRLKGVVKKKGRRAAICILFDAFSTTVFAEDEAELETWNIGDTIRFEIYSLVHRRKGPIIRAKSLQASSSSRHVFPDNVAEHWDKEENAEINGEVILHKEMENSEDESRSLRKEKKRKRKKIKQEAALDGNVTQEDINNSILDDDCLEVSPEEELHCRKKKKKKKKSSDND